MKKIFIAILTMACSISISAQTSLSKEEVEQAKKRAAEKVGIFTGYIKDIGDKRVTIENRLYYCQEALNLFVGKGDSYTETYYEDSTPRVVKRKGVQMQVTSLRDKSKKKPYLLKEYLNNLANLRYSQVKIESTDVAHMKIGNLYKVGDNTYKCTCFFKQAFIGYKDGKPVYKDITEKKVDCYIIAENIIGGATEYMVQLGDVTALETQSMSGNSVIDVLDILNK